MGRLKTGSTPSRVASQPSQPPFLARLWDCRTSGVNASTNQSGPRCEWVKDGNQKEHARQAKNWYEMCNYMTPFPGLAQEISTRCQSSPNIPDFQAGAWSTCRSSQCVQLGPHQQKQRTATLLGAESPPAFWVPNAAAPAGPRRRRRNQQASHQGSRPGWDPVCCPGGAPVFC